MVFWPVYSPLAVLAIERDPVRRRFQSLCLVAGAVAATYLAWHLISTRPVGAIQVGHIVYRTDPVVPRSIFLMYVLATGIAPALSSDRIVTMFAAVLLVGLVISYLFYWQALTSVWCFFAAAGSFVILAHFRHERRSEQLSS